MLYTIIGSIVGFVIGGFAFFYVGVQYRKKVVEATIKSAEEQAQKIVEDGKIDAERIKKEAILQL